MKKQLSFTIKQWNKFNIDKQEILTKQFEVILTNYKIRKEKIVDIVERIDITRPRGKKNFDKIITKVQSGIAKFAKVVENFNGKNLFPSQAEYDSLIGPDSKKDVKKIIWGDKKTLIGLGVCLVLLLIPLQAEARKNIEDIGIALDRTCLALIKEQMKTDCPTYEELLLIYPDTSNKRISGDFVFKNGILQRSFPQYQNHMNAYTYEKAMTWIDPPADTRDRIKLITIASSLPLYMVDESGQKKNNTIILGKDRWVDPRCHTAIISAEKWLLLLNDTIQYLKSGCTKTNFDSMVKIYQDPIKHDYKSSTWYKYKQWLESAKLQSKNKFLINPERNIYSPEAR